jgi:hypothetical protein
MIISLEDFADEWKNKKVQMNVSQKRVRKINYKITFIENKTEIWRTTLSLMLKL